MLTAEERKQIHEFLQSIAVLAVQAQEELEAQRWDKLDDILGLIEGDVEQIRKLFTFEDK